MQGYEDDQVIELAEEIVTVGKRVVETPVRVHVKTDTRVETANIDLEHTELVVDRVAIGRIVTTAPDIREEGDTTIVPVLEERLVVSKQLVLVEELHIRRVTRTERVSRDVVLRRQTATTERGPATA